MIRLIFIGLLAALVAQQAQAAEDARADFFVAPNGNDSWSGKVAAANAEKTDGPFATIAAAQRAARQKAQKPVKVLVRGGTYPLSEPLSFTPQDSQTEYAAYPVERPIFSGGVRVIGFTRNDKGHWVVTLPDVAAGKWDFVQLWVNGQRRYRPRLPKKGYYKIADTLQPSPRAEGKGFDRFKFAAGDVKADWHNLPDVELLVTQSWTMARMRVLSVEPDAQMVNFTGRTRGTQQYSSLRKDWPYLVENVKEALSEPGEWYLDRKTGQLTYIPIPGEQIDTAEVIAPKIERLVTISGTDSAPVQKLVLKGLTFAHGNWTTPPDGNNYPQAEINLGGAITLTRTRDCLIDSCDVLGVGVYAIDIAANNQRARVENCVLSDLGAGGVKIGLTRYERDEAKLTSHNTVKNCLITHGGRLHPAAVGLWVGHSPHNELVHNEISDFYYTGISVGWSWGYNPAGAHHNTIAHNHVHTLGQGVLSDMGGIYTLGLSDGTVIHHNLFHDIKAYDYGGWGIYFDEGTTNMLAHDNVVYNTKTGGFHQHYGRDNVVRNNIFAFSATDQLQRTRPEPHKSFTFEGNIVYWKTGTLLGSNWSDIDKYTMARNVYWRTDGQPIVFARVKGKDGKDRRLTLEEWQAAGQDRGSIVADPMFAEPDKGDFTLKEGSPALKLGFKPIDLTTVGPAKEVLARRPKAGPPAFPTGMSR